MWKKRKKLLALIISACMILTCLPGLSFADDEAMPTDEHIICKIGEKGFSSINEAVQYAETGKENIIVMVGDTIQTDTVTIPEDKNIVLKDDGTKKTITADKNSLFNVKGTLSIDASDDSNLVLDGGNCNSENIAHVEGTMNIKSCTINGGTVTSVKGAIYVEYGTLNMSGGIIQNTECNYGGFDAPVKIYTGAKMNMTGGEIRNNKGKGGGAIVATAAVTGKPITDEEMPVVNISGGKISNNTGTIGVAVMAAYYAKINISGGEISNNTDSLIGVTNNAGSGTIYASRSEVTMTGGTIKDNKMCKGGAMAVLNESKVAISGGSLLNNSAELYGGAIYILDNKPEFTIENTLITDNHATENGGGVWCCPTGTAKIIATEGVAIFDNMADAAGDDFTNICTDKQKFPVELSERMLGAGKVEYYHDGAILHDNTISTKEPEYWHGKTDTSVPRYSAASAKLKAEESGTKCLALKAIASEGAKASAAKNATVVISGNKAKFGGGIACNSGMVAIKHENKDDWSLKVKKVWDNVPKDKQVPVKVALVLDGEEVDTLELNNDNDWEATFTGLPNPETLKGNYSVVEKTEGFKVEYSEIKANGGNEKSLEVTVTNSSVTTPPGETPPGETPPGETPPGETPPTQPVTPPSIEDKPEEEETPPEKEVEKVKQHTETIEKNTPETGDRNNMLELLIGLTLASGAMLYIVIRRLRIK